MGLLPFFRYYGSKAQAAKRYPSPEHDTIIEPFAGSAGYACRYPERRVVLVDKSPIIAGVWEYLISASEREILAVPAVPEGGTVDDLNVCQEARWLVGFWCNYGTSTPRKSPSKRVQRNADWWQQARQRIASQVQHIRHWQIICANYTDAPDIEATHFVDPPYNNTAGQEYQHQIANPDRKEHRTKFGAPCIRHEYPALGQWCRSRRGLVIVCENTGADWLPFRPLCDTHGRHTSEEAVWLNRRPQTWWGVQAGLFERTGATL